MGTNGSYINWKNNMAKNTTPKPNPAKPCVCNKCNLEVGSAIPDSVHRNCGGQAGAKPRPYYDRLATADRGKWAVTP